MRRVCPDCGIGFEARGRWQKLCWSCWRAREDEKRYTEAWNAGYGAGRRAANGRPPEPRPRLDPELIRSAVALCHPDRHPPERAEQANRVTAALLELLVSARGGSPSA